MESWGHHWQGGKGQRGKTVEGVVGGVGGGVVEGWVGVGQGGQPQHGKDRRNESCGTMWGSNKAWR